MLREFLSGNSATSTRPSSRAPPACPNDPELVQRLIGQLQQALQNSGDGINWGLALEQAEELAARSGRAEHPRRALRARAGPARRGALARRGDRHRRADGRAGAAHPRRLGRGDHAGLDPARRAGRDLASPTRSPRVLEEQAPEELQRHDRQRRPADAQHRRHAVRDAARPGRRAARRARSSPAATSASRCSTANTGRPHSSPRTSTRSAPASTSRSTRCALYLAVRELAHARLFRHAKWLRLHLITQITDFARGIRIDTERLEELGGRTSTRRTPRSCAQAMTSGALIPPKTEEQLAALGRLETMLALVEGWVDVVTADATKRLPKSDAIAETVRRRRAAGGPGGVRVRHARRPRTATAPTAGGGGDVARGDGCRGRRRPGRPVGAPRHRSGRRGHRRPGRPHRSTHLRTCPRTTTSTAPCKSCSTTTRTTGRRSRRTRGLDTPLRGCSTDGVRAPLVE